MAININNMGNNPVVNQNLKRHADVQNQANQKAVSTSQVKTASTDSVSITPQAKQLSELQKKSDEPVIDKKKVEELKKAISAGEYKIDPDKLAASMANLELQLI